MNRRVSFAGAWSIVFAMLAAACSDPAGPENRAPGLRSIAGADLADTIQSRPPQALVVELRGEDGELEAGTIVRFDAVWGEESAPIFVSALDGTGFGMSAAVATDERGRAAVRIAFGGIAGDGSVHVSAPTYALVDTVHYEVLPGAPARMEMSPRDTLIEVGDVFTFESAFTDRNGNPVPALAATFTGGGDAATVTASGVVTAVTMGAIRVRASGTLDGQIVRDSVVVGVVTSARVAWWQNDGLWSSTLTGEDRQLLAPRGAAAPAYHPDGQRIAYAADEKLWLRTASGDHVHIPTPDLTAVNWPEFSADGEWIYFNARLDWNHDVYRIRIDGSGLENLSAGLGGRDSSPSPDGRYVAWVSETSRMIVIHDLVTGEDRTITAAADAVGPRWSPDGQWIAYTSGFEAELMLVRPDGADLHAIGDQGLLAGIAWSPDSRLILGVAYRGSIITDVQTGVMVTLPFTGYNPSWQP